MPDSSSDTDTKPDLAKRQREQVQALLSRAPATGSGRVTTAAGLTLGYQVRAAFVPVYTAGLDADRGEPQAAVLTTAYTVATTPDRPQRGVCFAFNGGPGSASLWLHLGALGPKRVPVDDNGRLLPAPYGLVDNPHTWLGQFDLVFIDPPHTGWSASASDAARKKHLSVDGDVAVMAEVVRGWLAANGRFGAPLYLCGESYGTTRGAAIADALLDQGLGLDGVILVSCAMDLQSLVFAPRNDLPHALFLPAYAATAQYHGALDGALAASGEAARQAAEAFVAEDYLSALHAGARLDGARRRRIAKRLCELTGLPRAVVEEHNLRIRDSVFFVEALRARGQLVGRLDSRATAPMAAARERQMAFDPGIEGIAVPYTTAAMAYFATLGLPVEQRYEALNFDVNRQWEWRRGKGEGMVEANGFTSTGDDLARALRRNPNTRVLVASGRYDLGTPYSATDWSLAQLDAPAEVLARIRHRYYDAGHMMYTRQADLAQMQIDLAAWLAEAAPSPAEQPVG